MSNAANNGGKWIRQDKRLALYLRDGFACVYCGEVLESGSTLLTLDHVTPQALGGSNDEGNLVTCCKRCNSEKRDLRLGDWLQVLADRGVDTDELPRKIRRHTRRSIKRHRKVAKQIINAR